MTEESTFSDYVLAYMKDNPDSVVSLRVHSPFSAMTEESTFSDYVLAYMKDNPDSFVSLRVHSPDNPSVRLSCSPDISRVIQDFTSTSDIGDFPKRTREICNIYRHVIAQVQRAAIRHILSSTHKGKVKRKKNVTVWVEYTCHLTGPMEVKGTIHLSENAPSYLTDSIVNVDFSKLREAMMEMAGEVLYLHCFLLKKLKQTSLEVCANWSPSERFLEEPVEVYLPNGDLTMTVSVFLSRSWRTLWCVILQGIAYHVCVASLDSAPVHFHDFEQTTNVCELYFWQLRLAANEHGPYLPENKTLPQPSGEPKSEYDIMITLYMDLDLHMSRSIIALSQCPEYLTRGISNETNDVWHNLTCLAYETMKSVREKTKSLQDREEEDLTYRNQVIPYMMDNGPVRIELTVDVFVRRQPTVTVITLPASLGHILDTHPGRRNPYPDRIGFACSSLVEKLHGVYQKVKPYLLPLPGQEPDVSFTYVRVESTVTFESISYGPNSPADLPSKVRRARKRCTWSLFDEMATLMFREYYFSKFPLFTVPEGVNPIDWID